MFKDFIYSNYGPKEGKAQAPQREKNIKAPDFRIEIISLEKKRLTDAKGDYDIQIVRDNGERISLRFGHRGDKMFYLLTLLCQKTVGGLPTKFFSIDSSKLAFKKVYDEVFRSGGDDWVKSMASETHHFSVCRSHAKAAIEKGNSLDLNTAYWSNLDTIALYIGPKKKKLQVRRIRLPEDRIVINDNGSLTQYLSSLPSLEQTMGYISPNAAKVMEMHLPFTRGRLEEGKAYMLDE